MLAIDIRLPCALQWCAASPGETPVRLSSPLATDMNVE